MFAFFADFLAPACYLSLFFVVPVTAYLATARSGHWAWPSPVTYVPAALPEVGPYRGPAMPLLVPQASPRAGGAPGVVRAAAFASYFLGQMFLPGLLCAIYGLLCCGLGLVGIPGLYLAFRIFVLGTHLLRREPGVAERAERAARLAFALNAVVVAAGLGFVWVFGHEEYEIQGVYFGVFLIAYALVSIGHGVLLKRAAAAIRALTPLER
jgi:hypothetical protein